MNKENIYEAIDIAQSIIDDKIDIIQACRDLNYLCLELNIKNADQLSFISSIDSDVEVFPQEHTRKHYNKAYLEKLDEKQEKYLKEKKVDIVNFCLELIKYLRDELKK